MNFQDLVYELLNLQRLTSEQLKDAQRAFAKKNNLNTLPSKSQILQAYFDLLKAGKITKNSDFELLLRKRAIRSMSGIVSVQVLTKPYPCPSSCIFCPNDPEMPKSYIKSEPGAMRAWLNQFDPIKQVYNRLYSLQQTGHKTDKIEMIVLGGTWDFYPDDYKREFIQRLYDACNTFSQLEIVKKEEKSDWKYGFSIVNEDQIQLSTSLADAIQKNETAEHRIIGLTVETTPPFVTHQNCRERREMGVTRIEMGVQSTDNRILEMNRRGHTIEEIRVAMDRLRQYGFKMSIHIMPGLYGSSVEQDIQTFREIYDEVQLRPDEIKFYPTSVIPNTELYTLYLEGKYQPITTEEIQHIICETFREIIPPYTRIKRLIRDIPATEISAGSNVTNLSQLMHETLLKEYQKSDESYRGAFYQRLYPNLEVFSDEEVFVEACVGRNDADFFQLSQIVNASRGEDVRLYPDKITPSPSLRKRGNAEGDFESNNEACFSKRVFAQTTPPSFSKEGDGGWISPYQHLKIQGNIGYFDLANAVEYIKKNRLITNGSLPYHADAKAKAKILRKHQTPMEQKLWDLYLKKIEFNIYRQKPIDHFIADFYIPACKLVIEVDGGIHSSVAQQEYDVWRSEILKLYGVVVARITNQDIENHFDQVVAELDDLISLLIKKKEDFNPLENHLQNPSSLQSFILGQTPNVSDFRHFVSLDTRSREMRNKTETTQQLNLVVRKYASGVGIEYFISFEDELGYLYGFTRLCLIDREMVVDRKGLGTGTALIRELHVYGSLQGLQQQEEHAKVQHSGLGKQLLTMAEKLASSAGYKRLSVISGVGVREYYRKLGYESEGTYVVKKLK